ncbi:GNAT family N-acetyltransferase [Thermomonas aquatica]|uniref:N-acetyltransferase n=1 Tax=Thermomonas aquatica TaxID=2202149 RepID=A0A5B7ZV51_9GAMM|nr:GNAT family N-acetyltransferase [Thermomonas aquatica]QDA58363.1 N-acetyltransferase [Thermomonas aquatica]
MSEIRHDAAHHRFVTEVDGHLAYVEYVPGDNAIAITHTIVPAAIGGRGIAGNLVRAALLHARNEGLKVEPLCSYADAWMRRHPEFDALRA